MNNGEKRPGSIGIAGCGSIGRTIVKAVTSGKVNALITGLWDQDIQAASLLAGQLNNRECRSCLEFSEAFHTDTVSVTESPNQPDADLIASNPDELAARCDLIVECAATSAVEALAQTCINSGVSLMVLSVGGITQDIMDAFENSCSNLYIPSGAICGIDGITAHSTASIEKITLTTRKPPQSLKNSEYIRSKGIDLEHLSEPTLIFEGPPAEAVMHFPKNINVSTALALAGSGYAFSSPACKKPGSLYRPSITVRIFADPTIERNIHQIELHSALGRINVTVENSPSPDNPATSALASLSAIALLQKIHSRVKIGT